MEKSKKRFITKAAPVALIKTECLAREEFVLVTLAAPNHPLPDFSALVIFSKGECIKYAEIYTFTSIAEAVPIGCQQL